MAYRNPTKVFQWYVSASVNAQYEDYLGQLGETVDGSDEREALVDAIRSLPNFPLEMTSPHDHLFPIVTSVTTSSARVH